SSARFRCKSGLDEAGLSRQKLAADLRFRFSGAGAIIVDSLTRGRLSLLFAPDHRPDAAAILDFCERIDAFSASYAEGGTADDDPAKGCWVEMLASGLVFDLCGLAPGPPGAAERCEFTTDLEGEATEWSARGLEAITLGPGPHLQGGEAVIPVVRTMCWVGAQLSELSGVEALAWHAAGSWISPSFFRSSTMHWLDGGPFPARGLTAHKPTPDGGLQ